MQFINIVNLFKKKTIEHVTNVVLFIYSTTLKNYRNNLEKSGPEGVRLLSYGDKTIQWSHLYQAYKWD